MMFEELTKRGLNGSLAIDVGSVLWGRRSFGLAHVPTGRLDAFVKVLGGGGLQAKVSRRLTPSRDPITGQFSLSARGAVIDEQVCEVWFSAGSLDSDTIQSLMAAPGERLGYPKCCTDAYSEEHDFVNFYNRYALEGGRRNWRLNRFASFFDDARLTLDYLPCSLRCCASARLASDYAPFLEGALGHRELARRIALNQMIYGVIAGHVVRVSKFTFDDQGNLLVRARDMVKSDVRLGVDLRNREFGIFSFDSTGTSFDQMSKAFVESADHVWTLRVQIL